MGERMMESLQDSLQKFLEEKKLKQGLTTSIEQLLQHQEMIKWRAEHGEWSEAELLPSITKIREFIKERENCQACTQLTSCPNLLKGHFAQLIPYGPMLDLSYSPCSLFIKAEEQHQRQKLIKSHHIPKDIINGSFRDFYQEEGGRLDAFNAVLEFCLHVQPGESAVGLYLYGPLGVGKSYLLGAACNKLAERNIASLMVYTPEFFREIKESIADQTLAAKLEILKEIPVLILDDLGAETLSPWARDEVLGSILQYRMMEKLPTLYSSNYDYEQLEDHLAYSQKGGVEQLKAKRILERIRHYTDAYFVNGKNYRIR